MIDPVAEAWMAERTEHVIEQIRQSVLNGIRQEYVRIRFHSWGNEGFTLDHLNPEQLRAKVQPLVGARGGADSLTRVTGLGPSDIIQMLDYIDLLEALVAEAAEDL